MQKDILTKLETAGTLLNHFLDTFPGCLGRHEDTLNNAAEEIRQAIEIAKQGGAA